MKKILLATGVFAAILLASCTSKAPQTQQTNNNVADSLQITNPELWAAQNQKLQLNPNRGVMQNPLDLNGFIQIAIIVEDIEVAAKEWSQLLNVPIPEIRILQTVETTDPNLMYYGKNYKYGLKLASIMAPQGFIIELHQVLDNNPNTYNEFIREHGYGVHHLGFAVGNRRDSVVNELIDRGYPKRVEHIYPSGSWTIIDCEQSLGVNLNIKPAM
ncbi:MAG: VOC family protein [Salinivirgaceae bacterium]|nr:VOC family protein [Salinivirgaceae bacterium]